MITPPYLIKGDLIGLVSPAGLIEAEKLSSAGALLKRMGFRVIHGNNISARHHQFAGTDDQRAADFQQMLDNPDVRMILCTRGGYGAVRIIDKLDFGNYLQNPKWIAGYSDITVIQNHLLARHGVESIHGIMPMNFPECGDVCPAVDKLFQVACGRKPAYQVPSHPLNRQGKSKGMLIGGNLSILLSLIGSLSEVDFDGNMLFIEDAGERLYHLDRMMISLKRSGRLNNLAGLVVGGLTEMTDSKAGFGKKAEEIVYDAVKDFDYLVCFGFPAGHIRDNYPLIIGREIAIDVGEQSVRLDFFDKNNPDG